MRIRCSSTAVADASALLWWLNHPVTAPRPRRPVSGLRAAVQILRHAPIVTPRLSASPAGRDIERYLRRARLGVHWRLCARSCVEVSGPGQPLFRGRALQAVRTNMKRARAAGFTVRESVSPGLRPGERLFLLLDPTGNPTGRVRVSFDSEWACIWNLEARPAVGLYLLHGHVVAEMQRAGIGHLLVASGNVLRLRPGLVYLQGRLGYRVVHIRFRPKGARTHPPLPEPGLAAPDAGPAEAERRAPLVVAETAV